MDRIRPWLTRMSDEDSVPIFVRGDVVFGTDPFKGDETARPWVIVSNHEGREFHGEQYIGLTLTTKSWHEDLIDIPDEAWTAGGTPDDSRIVPWGVQSLHGDEIDFWQGRLAPSIVDDAVGHLIRELEGP